MVLSAKSSREVVKMVEVTSNPHVYSFEAESHSGPFQYSPGTSS